MRLSIRLQNHGKKNHPYWWIVVAPQHKNIFGRYTEHIGYWSPRHNVNIKRQIILNIPRLMYWLGNGAVPTFRIHKFLNMYGIFPKPWKYASTHPSYSATRVSSRVGRRAEEAKTLLGNDSKVEKSGGPKTEARGPHLAPQVKLSPVRGIRDAGAQTSSTAAGETT